MIMMNRSYSIFIEGADIMTESGNSSVGRAPASQAGGGGFEPRFPLHAVSLKERERVGTGGILGVNKPLHSAEKRG